jgi:hypothetical protein
MASNYPGIPSTWRSERFGENLQLSGAMKAALIASVRAGRSVPITGGTLGALVKRGLCDSSGEINPFGRITAICHLTLPEQCRALRISLEVHQHEWQGRPEQSVLSLLPDKPQWAFVDEGKMLHALIHAIVLPRLYLMASKAWNETAGYDRARSWLYGFYAGYRDLLEIDPRLTERMLEDIDEWDRAAFVASWRMLAEWNHEFGFHPAAHITSDLALAVLDGVGEPRLSAIAAKVFSEPFAYYHGWPDVMLLDSDGKLSFIEVKTTDKLHYGQIITMVDMREAANLNIRVMRLHRRSRSFVRDI